jgi:hypothetical protein
MAVEIARARSVPVLSVRFANSAQSDADSVDKSVASTTGSALVADSYGSLMPAYVYPENIKSTAV